jgi:hypothetical protein
MSGASLAGIAPAGWSLLPMSRSGVGRRRRVARRSNESRDRVAAFFCEPVIGAGGVYAPPGYRRVRGL